MRFFVFRFKTTGRETLSKFKAQCLGTKTGEQGMMQSMQENNINSAIRLHDGRKLGMASVGKPDGFPIFHFHGRGISRLEVLLLASVAEKLGVRLVGLDRPGIGLSHAKAGYRILDWPNDVVEVADQLGIERFAVEGLSAGAAYAMACAYEIPERLTACGLISSVNPGYLIRKNAPLLKRTISLTVEHLSWLLRAVMRRVLPASPNRASIEKVLARFEALTAEPDWVLLRNPAFRKEFAQGITEGLRQGNDGNVEDIIRQVSSWDFKVEDIAFPKVFL
jgi:pimeloyl-ACP methyl ester carboxylesterase